MRSLSSPLVASAVTVYGCTVVDVDAASALPVLVAWSSPSETTPVVVWIASAKLLDVPFNVSGTDKDSLPSEPALCSGATEAVIIESLVSLETLLSDVSAGVINAGELSVVVSFDIVGVSPASLDALPSVASVGTDTLLGVVSSDGAGTSFGVTLEEPLSAGISDGVATPPL